jgi:GNAT superfamily N-acetyltransferase|tara:strand:- start:101 stop:550 length:450 start_codon:yes stop_codon:yes gene_type:complete
MDVIVWLKEMFRRELDLRPPSLAKINEKSVIIYDNDNIPIAHAIRTNRWEGFEINSLVVDPNHRGKGISHKLLEKCGTGRLFAYTRDVRLQSALEKAGFERSTTPGFLSSLNVLISRLAMISWMILSLEFKRIMHQLKHIRDYKLYVRE